ncbi:hypothetical protein K458DRAFT_424601 [Lentithecium fluviatile CBS 122367]|uniref:Uncharacterized protein n=1 Tax=Lentithecium fluviatile CBS 122367 TaxID=1168545 RepID=A0A6G1IFF1_9PLEO|nr:hypothetical protein K458DRAFT_424601 [Lentithecium fluviatile CBS 122367]
MPALPELSDATGPLLDSLAPREPDAPSRIAPRHPKDQLEPYDANVPTAIRERAIQARATTIGIIPTYYRIDGPAPGAVVGLVLGSVAGFILIIWLLYSLTQGAGIVGGRGTIAAEEEIVVRRPRRHSHGGRSRPRSTRTEVREYGGGSPRRSGGSRSQVIVEERRTGPRPRSIVVEERSRVRGDDEVVVIEEEDDYMPRRNSRRTGGYR